MACLSSTLQLVPARASPDAPSGGRRKRQRRAGTTEDLDAAALDAGDLDGVALGRGLVVLALAAADDSAATSVSCFCCYCICCSGLPGLPLTLASPWAQAGPGASAVQPPGPPAYKGDPQFMVTTNLTTVQGYWNECVRPGGIRCVGGGVQELHLVAACPGAG